MNLLRLEWKRREGGGGKTQRDYLDFVIDNASLSEEFDDMISCLGWFVAGENEKAVRRLLLEELADFPNNRRSLYVCPECGDVSCGAVSIVIEEDENHIIWRDFAVEHNWSDDLIKRDNIGSFIFDKTEYRKVIKSAL